MADFNFTVDTNPMAQSIGVVSQSVNTVSIAVTAMEAAVIAAEQEAASHVSNKVDQGFFLLIRSQISQKVAHLNSNATSKLMSLRQLAIALQGIKRQMERDYHMISARYKKLFNTLDKSLQQRVYELDKTPSDLSSKQYPNIVNRLRNLGTSFITNQNEIVPMGQLTAAARFKIDTNNLIRSIEGNLKEQNTLKDKLQKSLNSESIHTKKPVFVPLIMSEADGLGGMGSIRTIHTPPLSGEFSKSTSGIKNHLQTLFDKLMWTDIRTEDESKVLREVEALCAANGLDKRIQVEITRLCTSCKLKVLNEKGL